MQWRPVFFHSILVFISFAELHMTKKYSVHLDILKTMTKLFESITIGGSEYAHRIVMAPLTRYRCDDEWIPLPIVKGKLNLNI